MFVNGFVIFLTCSSATTITTKVVLRSSRFFAQKMQSVLLHSAQSFFNNFVVFLTMSLFFFAGFQIFLFSYASLIGNHTICQLKYSSSGLVMQATWVTISPARLNPFCSKYRKPSFKLSSDKYFPDRDGTQV